MTVKKEGRKVVVVTSSINNHKRPIVVKSIQSILPPANCGHVNLNSIL